jgi:hypothetical protein
MQQVGCEKATAISALSRELVVDQRATRRTGIFRRPGGARHGTNRGGF